MTAMANLLPDRSELVDSIYDNVFLSVSMRDGSIDHAKLLDDLLSAGADTEVRDSKGRTMLLRAAKAGDMDAMKSLVAAGANRYARDDSGMGLGEICLGRPDPELLAFALSVPGMLNRQDHQGLKLLHHAAQEGGERNILLLHQMGLDVGEPDRAGFTPMAHAVRGVMRQVTTGTLLRMNGLRALVALGVEPLSPQQVTDITTQFQGGWLRASRAVAVGEMNEIMAQSPLMNATQTVCSDLLRHVLSRSEAFDRADLDGCRQWAAQADRLVIDDVRELLNSFVMASEASRAIEKLRLRGAHAHEPNGVYGVDRIDGIDGIDKGVAKGPRLRV